MFHIRDIFLSQGVPELYRSNRTSIADNNMFGRTTPEPLSAPTQKLFQAIDDENLEDFKQAVAEGANINAFDEEGMAPLMSIVNGYAVSSYGQHTLEKMAKLLIQNRSININARSKQHVYKERQKRDSQGRKVFPYLGREIVCQSGNRYMYCDDKSLVKDGEDFPILFTTDFWDFLRDSRFKLLTEGYEGVMKRVKTGNTEKKYSFACCLPGWS